MKPPKIIRGGRVARGTALERSKRDEVSPVPAGDAAMEAAFAKARATLDEFLAVLAAPPPDIDLFAVKIRVVDGKAVEYFWVTDFEHDGDRFTGRIDNTPRGVKTVQLGQIVTFARDEIYDWMYGDSTRRRMFGNFTVQVLLDRESPEEAAELRREAGLLRD